jgi:hypothetical protein
MPFDIKLWLDTNVIPLLGTELLLHAVACDKSPTASVPETVLCWTLVQAATDWAPVVERLLKHSGFRFDYLRDVQLLPAGPSQTVQIFGGSGSPFLRADGMLITRLYRRQEDIALLVEVGHKFESGAAAIAAVKDFFARFDGAEPAAVLEQIGAPFGAA